MIRLKPVIAPSILSADFAMLYEDCKSVLDAGAQSLHIDIMDGHFVPNLTIGAPVVQSLRKHLPNTHFDCHLMVSYPQHYIEPLKKAKANCITFHYESSYDSIDSICALIRNHGMEVGLSVKPKTEISPDIDALITAKKIDKLLVMTVQPGFGGQSFMSDMLPKIKYLRAKHPFLDIQVDGGITTENIDLVASYGANCIVSGSGIFCVTNRKAAISSMHESVEKYLE